MTSSVRLGAAFFALLAGAGVLAGCNGNNSTSPGNCGAPSGKVVLVYPAPGSTGISDNFPGVIFGSSNGLGGNYQALIVAAGSQQGSYISLNLVGQAPTPLPTPNLVPSFPNPIYQESSSAGTGALPLAANTQYAVYLNDSGSNCNPSYQGSFTSQ